MSVVARNSVSRISVSLPHELQQQFDRVVGARGFESRSQAIVELIRDRIMEHQKQLGDEIMAGTITLVYDHSKPGLQKQLADLQHRYVDEVISSLHVNLVQAHIMEVILVQGPASRLQRIADELGTCRGVITAKLQLTTAILPPVHPLPAAINSTKLENRT